MKKITMAQQTRYKIIVSGKIPREWIQLEEELQIEVTLAENTQMATILIGKLDQAALIGLLRRLYSLGLPILSIECLDSKKAA